MTKSNYISVIEFWAEFANWVGFWCSWKRRRLTHIIYFSSMIWSLQAVARITSRIFSAKWDWKIASILKWSLLCVVEMTLHYLNTTVPAGELRQYFIPQSALHLFTITFTGYFLLYRGIWEFSAKFRHPCTFYVSTCGPGMQIPDISNGDLWLESSAKTQASWAIIWDVLRYPRDAQNWWWSWDVQNTFV